MIEITVWVVFELDNENEIFGVYNTPEIAKEEIENYHKEHEQDIVSVRMLSRLYTVDIVERAYDITVMVEGRQKEYNYSARRTRYYY